MRTALGQGQPLVKRSDAVPLKRGLSNIFCHFKRVRVIEQMEEVSEENKRRYYWKFWMNGLCENCSAFYKENGGRGVGKESERLNDQVVGEV